MELRHIELANLTVSSANMRVKGKAPDLTNILPSVRARGVLVPLIVRAAEAIDTYEIVAGKRRYHAALIVAEETGDAEPLPCAIMVAGDDAAALEASLIENVARLDPDEVTRWESFTRLVREGRSSDDIAQTFGLTELQVRRTLALGNLLPRIRALYRRGDIEVGTVRQLTLASKAQQRDWLALLDDPSAYCPSGHALKAWLFGGASIPVSAALFDLAAYDGAIVSDLFGDERYFADAAAFWTMQTTAVEKRAAGYREAGWSEVIVHADWRGVPFGWEYERTPKRKGGKVYIAVGTRGDVAFHESYLTLKEARKLAAGGEAIDKACSSRDQCAAPELCRSSPACRCPQRTRWQRRRSAFRLAVAHMIAGSSLWSVRIEPQRAASDAIAESDETCASEAAFDQKRRAVLAILGFDAETPTVTGGYDGDHGMVGVFARLLPLPDAAVRDIMSIVMAETLEAGSAAIEMLGILLGVDMAAVWQADDVLLDLIRDREVLGAILVDVAGETVAAANDAATGKIKRQIVRDCLTGENGRTQVTGWVPRWMAFPPSAYTERGGVGSVSRSAQIAHVIVEPQPAAQPIRIAA